MKSTPSRLVAFALLGLLMTLSFAADSQRKSDAAAKRSERRVALVIGNAAYPLAGVLKNPANDAKDIAAKLEKLGFDVILRTDVRQKDMLRTLTEFGDKVLPGTEAVFFYAGHGMQVRGKNYLVPIDAEIRNEASVSTEAVDVDQLLDKLSPARLSMVILDACRNNPFERRFRGGGQGLAQMNAPTGTLIAYATAPGKVAADGEGRNGLYTAELLSAMEIPGIRIEDVFKRVRARVVKMSGEAQTPWESSSLTGDFYLTPQEPTGTQIQPQPQFPLDPDVETWKAAATINTGAAYRDYIGAYPNGRYVAAAKIRLSALKQSGQQTPALPSLGGTEPPPTGQKVTTTAFTVGTVFRDSLSEGGKGPEMVVLPTGTYWRGAVTGDMEAEFNERPAKEITIDYQLAVGKYEVTFEDWKQCVAGNGCRSNPSPRGLSRDRSRHPVVNISWKDAKEYVEWLKGQTGKLYRLLSELEWEYAARGEQRGRQVSPPFAQLKRKDGSWTSGSCLHDDVANYSGNSFGTGCKEPVKFRGDTVEVGSLNSPNRFGLHDMHGNVNEWVEDCYTNDYLNAPVLGRKEDGSAVLGCSSEADRAWRGGSWYETSLNLRSGRRNGSRATYWSNETGFRIARPIP